MKSTVCKSCPVLHRQVIMFIKRRGCVGSGSCFPPFRHSGPNYQATIDWLLHPTVMINMEQSEALKVLWT